MRTRTLVILAAAAALVFAGCSDDAKKSDKEEGTTTTPKAPPVAPLTGLADPSGASLTRCALNVKIENDADARPQAGVAQADVVYDQVIDGGITRLLAMFNSEVPEAVGPVRSVRPIDPKLVWPVGGVFAYSGDTPDNVKAISAVPNLKPVDENDRAALYRVKSRAAPRNLYGHPDVLFQRCPKAQAPPPLFQYRGPNAPAPVGEPVQAANVEVSPDKSFAVTYTWNGTTWDRSMRSGPYKDDKGTQVSPANAIVMFLQWDGRVGTFNAEGITIGSGDAWIFTNGVVVKGKWSRPAVERPAVYTDATGAPVLLTPGRTWVELAPVGQAVTITAPPAPAPPAPAPQP